MSVSIRDFCNLDEKFSRSSRIVVMVILFEVKIVPRVFHSVSLSLLPLVSHRRNRRTTRDRRRETRRANHTPPFRTG